MARTTNDVEVILFELLFLILNREQWKELILKN